MQKILISGCLIGEKVRYHGKDALCDSNFIAQWLTDGRIVSICPEVSAGLPIPRESCEIIGGSGHDVINGKARVVSKIETDLTDDFIKGAYNALGLVRKYNIRMGILKSNSPSCGNKNIYDGSHSGITIAGSGVTAALLQAHGVKVFNEFEINEAVQYLRAIEIAG